MRRDQLIADAQRKRHEREVEQQNRDEKRRLKKIAERAETARLVDARRAKRGAWG